MAELLQTLSSVSFILAVVLAAAGILIFFVLDIRAVVGELSGKTATSEIARIREEGTSRTHRARSLQSIVLDKGTESADFSVEGLGIKAATGETARQEASLLDQAREVPIEKASEQETGFLNLKSASEDETGFLRPENVSEDETGFLSPETDDEQEASLLGSSSPAEQETGFLSPDES